MTALSTSIVTDATTRLSTTATTIAALPVDGTIESILRLSEIVDAALDVSAAVAAIDDDGADEDAIVDVFVADLRLCELLAH